MIQTPSIGIRGRYLNYPEEDLLQEYLKAVIMASELKALIWTIAIIAQKDIQYSVIFGHGFMTY